MRCVHVGRLEMPSAHLSRTMYQPECVSAGVFSILKLQLGGCFATRVLVLPGKILPVLDCSGVTLKCPLCSATVP